MTVGVPTEIAAGEKRVSATPDTVQKIIKLGFQVRVQAGAGLEASLSDEAFVQAGAEIVGSASELYKACDVILKV